ncbi:MAG: hypothetical protein IJT90_00020 [Bacteroidaceae bacterium]|nr:hypothetical protein [Bacteroidaceae bacterium]
MKLGIILKSLFVVSLCMCYCSSCSNDDDEDMVDIYVQVSVRVDSHVPPQVTVFGEALPLNNDSWKITLESFRSYEGYLTIRRDRVKKVPLGPLLSDSPLLEGIFSIQAVQGKRVFRVHTQTEGNKYLFVIS